MKARDTGNSGGKAFPGKVEFKGPCFDPISGVDVATGEMRVYVETGMTLRDYFAAKAPITVEDAMAACGVGAHSIGMLPAANRVVILVALATMRGEYADAMLAERAK